MLNYISNKGMLQCHDGLVYFRPIKTQLLFKPYLASFRQIGIHVYILLHNYSFFSVNLDDCYYRRILNTYIAYHIN